MVSLTIDRLEGETIPRGYAPAYVVYERDAIVCAPLGVHLVLRWARNLVLWLRWRGWPGAIEEAYRQGRAYGYEAGRSSGITSGWRAAQRAIEAQTRG